MNEFVKIELNIKRSEALMLAEYIRIAGKPKEELWPEQRFGLSSDDCEAIKNRVVSKMASAGNLGQSIDINDQAVLEKLAEFSGYQSAEKLVQYLISSIIDGARRPGSWERQVMYTLGIESNNDDYVNSSEQLLEHYKRESLS